MDVRDLDFLVMIKYICAAHYKVINKIKMLTIAKFKQVLIM